MYFIATKRMLEVCFSAHPNIQYRTERAEIAACGDGLNDISMIQYAGLGIAMANAQEAVKRVCDFVTKSNEEEGVAYAIDRFILG